MASRTRRAKVVLGVIAFAVIGLGVWAWEPLYWWVTTKRVYWEYHTGGPMELPAVRGWKYESRWSDSKSVIREGICWYAESGLKVSEYVVEGDTVLTTQWKPDGTVWYQTIRRGYFHRLLLHHISAPWLWGVTDQTSPSMPAWMKDDEKWAKALEEAR